MSRVLSPDTIAVGHDSTLRVSGAVAPPIFQTSTFEEGSEFSYTRLGNPSVAGLERRVAQLEGMPHAIAFASGTAALSALARVLGRVGPIHLAKGGYAGTARLLREESAAGTLSFDQVEQRDSMDITAPSSFWIETPTNPFLIETSIRDLRTSLPRGVHIVVDNTLATPVLQRPGDHGADHVVHSASKYLGGHSDVIAGIVVTNEAAVADALQAFRCSHGACLDPFAAWLTLRGIQTLGVRMAHASASAALLARQLATHHLVERVWYPGLGPRPDGQMASGGAVVTIRLGEAVNPEAFLYALDLFSPAASLGGVESLANQCARMSHSSLPAAERSELGLDEHVMRLSIGLEDVDDLSDDLNQALNRAANNGDRTCTS